MAKRRSHRARKNPSTGMWIALGAGAVAVGVGVYLLTRPSSTTTSNQLTSSKAPAPFTATRLTIVRNPATGQEVPPGDKLIQITVPGQSGTGYILLSAACASAARLQAAGSPDAAAWVAVCTQNGGVVPSTNAPTQSFTFNQPSQMPAFTPNIPPPVRSPI